MAVAADPRTEALAEAFDNFEAADAKWCADFAALLAIAELTGAIGAPGKHGPVLTKGQAVCHPDGNLLDPAQAQHLCRLRPRVVADFAVAEAAVDLVAPRKDDAAAGEHEGCPVAGGDHGRDRRPIRGRRLLGGSG